MPLGSFAQPSGKVWRIGILDYGSAESDYWNAFRERMGELGYVEGRNLAIEARSASGNQATLASEAAELVKLKVDLIVDPWNDCGSRCQGRNARNSHCHGHRRRPDARRTRQ